jgi:hypothetical protein
MPAAGASIRPGSVLSITEHYAVAGSFGGPAVKRIVLIVSASVWIIPATLCMAQTPLGWPEVIARLTQERMQAETCVGMIKSSKNAGAITAVKTTYETTKPRVDGAIAGLVAALVDGGKPEALPSVRDDLETTGKTLKEICDAALATLKSNSHQKGDWREAIAAAAVEATLKPLIDWLSEQWARLRETDKLEIETKKAQLEAAKWPAFADIRAQ